MFVSVRPDATTRERLSSLGLEASPGLRPTGPGQWHITLRFIGDVDQRLVPALVDAISSGVRAMVGPVHCDVGPETGWFPGGRVLQVPVAGLDELAAVVRSATGALAPDRAGGGPGFRGHLTIARTTGDGPEEPVRRRWAGIPFASAFAVGAVELVGSRPAAGGHRHTTLGTVALPG
jgi:2'-5' RNA ligase